VKVRRKPLIFEATRWFANGDHPNDACQTAHGIDGSFLTEGKIVRYYRHPKGDGADQCQHCKIIMHEHGWIDTKEGGHVVCPGDWIITGIKGEHWPVKPDIFDATYDKIKLLETV
jgi:hypothetical protein